jgi:hypothetical protein
MTNIRSVSAPDSVWAWIDLNEKSPSKLLQEKVFELKNEDSLDKTLNPTLENLMRKCEKLQREMDKLLIFIEERGLFDEFNSKYPIS